jgi:hypothetical protein
LQMAQKQELLATMTKVLIISELLFTVYKINRQNSEVH